MYVWDFFLLVKTQTLVFVAVATRPSKAVGTIFCFFTAQPNQHAL